MYGSSAETSKLPEDVRSKIQNLEIKYGIPNDLYLSLIERGEGGTPTAVSPKGAIGYAQLMPTTAKELGVNPWDIDQNLEGGAKYLSDQYNRFKDWRLSLAAYNAGPGAVQKYGGVPPFAETQSYLERIMGPQAAAAPSMMPGVSEAEAQAMAKYGSALEHGQQVSQEAEQNVRQTGERINQINAELQKMTATPRPPPPTLPDLPNQPHQDDYIKDPTRVLGQVLPGLAILGGLTMRNGAVKAMRAASAAMNAARQNDKDAYERAHQEWKDKMDMVLKRAELERQQYLDVLEDRRMSLQEKLSEMQVLAAKDGNQNMLTMIANGQTGEIYKYLQMTDAMAYRGYQVLDMAQRRDLERERLNLERQKAEDMAKYRDQMAQAAQDRAKNKTLGQYVSDRLQARAEARASGDESAWTEADEQDLQIAMATLQRMNVGAMYGGGESGAGGPAVPPPAASDIAYLKAHDSPALRKAFDAKYGEGAAAKALGK